MSRISYHCSEITEELGLQREGEGRLVGRWSRRKGGEVVHKEGRGSGREGGEVVQMGGRGGGPEIREGRWSRNKGGEVVQK